MFSLFGVIAVFIAGIVIDRIFYEKINELWGKFLDLFKKKEEKD